MTDFKYRFSDELMARGQKYFTEKAGRGVILEETETWLDSLANLYLIFNEIRLSKK